MSAGSVISRDGRLRVKEECSDDDYDEVPGTPPATRVPNPFYRRRLKSPEPMDITPENPKKRKHRIIKEEIDSSYVEESPRLEKHLRNIMHLETDTNSSIASSSMIFVNRDISSSREELFDDEEYYSDETNSSIAQTLIVVRDSPVSRRELSNRELENGTNSSVSSTLINSSVDRDEELIKEEQEQEQENDLDKSTNSSTTSTLIRSKRNRPVSRPKSSSNEQVNRTNSSLTFPLIDSPVSRAEELIIKQEQDQEQEQEQEHEQEQENDSDESTTPTLIRSKRTSPVSREKDSDKRTNSLTTSTLIRSKRTSPVPKQKPSTKNQQNHLQKSSNSSTVSTVIIARRNPPVSINEELLPKQEQGQEQDQETSSSIAPTIIRPRIPPPEEQFFPKQENSRQTETNSSMTPTIIRESSPANDLLIERENDFPDLRETSEVEVNFDENRRDLDSDEGSDPNEFVPDEEIDEVDEENDEVEEENEVNSEGSQSQSQNGTKRVRKENKYFPWKLYSGSEDRAMIRVLIDHEWIGTSLKESTWKRIADMKLPELEGRKGKSLYNHYTRQLLNMIRLRALTKDPQALVEFEEIKEEFEGKKGGGGRDSFLRGFL